MKIENNVNLNQLDNFTLFRIYYDRMMCLDLSNNMMQLLKALKEHHEAEIYGAEYNNELDIINEEFKCIVTFEKVN